MNKQLLFKKFEGSYIQSVSDFKSDDDFQQWANSVDPLIALVSHVYISQFRAARSNRVYDSISKTYKPPMGYMLEQFHLAYNNLKLDLTLNDEESTREYFSENSQFSIQKLISEFLVQSKDSIWVYDAYMDVKIIHELEIVKACDIKLLTIDKPNMLFFQRLEAFQKQFQNKKIEVRGCQNKQCHDRYLIIDTKRILHCGASLKHAGDTASNVHEMQNSEEVRKMISDYELWWESATPFKHDI